MRNVDTGATDYLEASCMQARLACYSENERNRGSCKRIMLSLNTARAARLTRCLKAAVLLLSTGMTILLWAAEQNHKQWSDYGGGPDSSHFIALDQINKSNVSQLQVAWVYPTRDAHAYLND